MFKSFHQFVRVGIILGRAHAQPGRPEINKEHFFQMFKTLKPIIKSQQQVLLYYT